MSDSINKYGDKLVENEGRGSDIASQRVDDLDTFALEFAKDRLVLGDDVHALDAGCGRCGMANRFAALGLSVDAVDAQDFADHAQQGVTFHQADLNGFLATAAGSYDLILCQRTIHYLPHAAASDALRGFFEHLKPTGRLYLSASGMSSELSQGYVVGTLPPNERFGQLSEQMREKHGIRDEVCLYRLSELEEALEAAGFQILQGFESEFGNVKIEAARD